MASDVSGSSDIGEDYDRKRSKKDEAKQRNDSEFSSGSIMDGDAGRCGWGSFTPNALQCCNNAKGFLAMYCLFVIVQGMLVNGFINVSISTLEKRFGLKSSETGVVSTGYDIAFCVLTMFVTYFLGSSHRPRIVAIGCFIMGVGAMVFWLPHFTTPKYEYTDSFSDTCVEDEDVQCEGTTTYLHNYLYVFILGQLLHGVGCTPLYTLGLAYLEDSVSKESASVYLGIANAASIFGPVVGYALGGVFLGYYVDFESVDMSTITITSSDPRWVGAWWLGMMVSMACAWVLVIPLFAFPKEFPGTERLRKMRESEVPPDAGEDITSDENFGKSYKDFPRALLILFKNPTYVFGSLAACSEALIISGFTTFLPKIIENQFQVTAGLAAIVAGVISIPGGVVGHVLAGILVNKFNMKTATIYKFNVVCCLLVCVGSPILFLACSNQDLAGITYSYGGNQSQIENNLTTSCNSNCSCQEEFYIPVCGANNINYFTACHAGCTVSNTTNGTLYYYDCQCVDAVTEEGWSAKEGFCDSNCTTLSAFLGVFFVVVMFTFMSSTPALVATFRVVPPKLRPFGLGVQWLLIRALGSIPGPIAFGSIIDMTCILWQVRQCDDTRGSCWVYSSYDMSINVLAISVAGKLTSSVLFSLACWFYKPPIGKIEENDINLQTAIVNDAFDLDDSNKTLSSSGDISDESFPQTDARKFNHSNVPSDTSSNDEPVTVL